MFSFRLGDTHHEIKYASADKFAAAATAAGFDLTELRRVLGALPGDAPPDPPAPLPEGAAFPAISSEPDIELNPEG